MSEEPLVQKHQRLNAILESETARAEVVNQKLHVTSLDIAKEKTQYIEKLALGSGAAIAAIVSFLGSHSNKLHPGWLLRAALISLALTMAASMYRNWRYPFYQYTFHARLHEQAVLRRENAKGEFISYFDVNDLETGSLLNKDEYLEQGRIDIGIIQTNVVNLSRKEEWIFNEVRYVELGALAFAVTGIVLLIALAWIHF